MARVPQNRTSRIVHTCPICGKESIPHDGAASEATQHLIDGGWSWTSRIPGGEWHLVCQRHRAPGKTRTLWKDTTARRAHWDKLRSSDLEDLPLD